MNHAKKTLLYFIGHTAIGIIALVYALLSHLSDGYREGVISGIVGGFLFTGILGIIVSIRLIKNLKKPGKQKSPKRKNEHNSLE